MFRLHLNFNLDFFLLFLLFKSKIPRFLITTLSKQSILRFLYLLFLRNNRLLLKQNILIECLSLHDIIFNIYCWFFNLSWFGFCRTEETVYFLLLRLLVCGLWDIGVYEGVYVYASVAVSQWGTYIWLSLFSNIRQSSLIISLSLSLCLYFDIILFIFLLNSNNNSLRFPRLLNLNINLFFIIFAMF